MAFEMNRIIFMALPFCVVGLSSPVEAEAVKETVKAMHVLLAKIQGDG